MTGGSQQLRLYRRARRDGATMMTACANSGIAVAEARLIETEDAKNPPPPEAFELLPITAHDAQSRKDDDMGRPKKNDAPIDGEIAKPDFDLAVSIYRNDIKPAQSKVGEHAQEMSTAFKEIKKNAHIQPQAARQAFRLDTMEEAKRDDWLRSFKGLLTALKIFMPVDLVDQAQGKGDVGESVVPIGARKQPALATIPKGPEGDTDLVDAAEPIAAE